ncbi:polysaccharide deacetylase family protein [Clostridium sp. C2-6-12]|uniref:polysaccharide deacetylase family protein n=1 Tax=Clostridium sp. C2-6-12 TaxID=2698832 RepID=UPI0019239EDC|nr:polysaccharide deacetylase family protein [Clostridium sp. C2-6-12]
MKYSNKKGRNRAKKIKKARVRVLFCILVAFMVCGSVIMAFKFAEGKKAVQTVQVVEQDDDQINTTDKNPLSNNSSKQSSDNGYTEDVAFIEKYLAQQMKNQMPEGADGKKVAYLTFDDGPSETVTPQILDILKAENVHATFFLIGKLIDKNEASKNLVKRELEEGNTIGIHSYSHDTGYLFGTGKIKKINLENCMSDFEKTDKSLKNVLGEDFSTRAIRFPGGLISWNRDDPKGAEAVEKALHEKDWHQVDWNTLSGDAEEGGKKNAEQLTQECIKTLGKREKAVILMHDTYGKEETAKALPGIIKYLKEQGYEFRVLK